MAKCHYSIVKLVPDPIREECINLGVIVVAEDRRASRCAFLVRFRTRLRALAPAVSADGIERIIESLKERCGEAYQPQLGTEAEDERIWTTDQLCTLSGVMRNQIQFTGPKAYQAASLRDATEELARLLVWPSARVPHAPEGMTLHELRRLIRNTLKSWAMGPLAVAEGRVERGERARHFADFWISGGDPVAAFVAIPEDPGERDIAWARRDSLPIIAGEFRRRYPLFSAVAVLPANGLQPTEFVEETLDFLRAYEGVRVTRVNDLTRLRDDILPRLS